MATLIELTLSTNYVKNWGIKEGIRELIQNARDIETEFSFPMEIYHDGYNLTIMNIKARLPHEALLIGYSTKEHKDLIGQFGEGLKLGLLVLIRAGFDITIQTGNETWQPFLQKSKMFNDQTVLTFSIDEKEFFDGVKIVVHNLNLDIWDTMKKHFLFLSPPKRVIPTPKGDIILDEDKKGFIFIKGIFVQESEYLHGYDFKDLKTDRDRFIVTTWKLQCEIAKIWDYILSHEEYNDIWDSGVALLEAEVPETNDFYFILSLKSITNLYDRMQALCNTKDAIPVSNLSQRNELEHLGKSCIIVSKTTQKVLERLIGRFADIRKNALNMSFKEVVNPKHDLALLNNILDSIKKSYSFATKNRVKICEFINNAIYGLHGEDGTIYVNQNILNNYKELLITLAHEFAHDFGDDGSKMHLDAVQIILAEYATRKGE